MPDSRPTLSPHILGQYFNLSNCQMYLTWEYDEDAQEDIESGDWETAQKSPLLMGQGVNFELRQLDALPSSDHHFVVPNNTDWAGFDEKVSTDQFISEEVVCEKIRRTATTNSSAEDVMLHQPQLDGEIGVYNVRGNADIIGLLPNDQPDELDIAVFEIKNSDEQKVSHRFQAAIYAGLISKLVLEEGYSIGSIRTTVITQNNNFVTDGIANVDDFEFGKYLAKLRLLLEEGSELDEILLETSYEDTYNRIDSRCAGCDFEPLCVSRGAESKGLELLGIDESTQRTLEEIEIDGGIQDLEDFAMLFEQPGSDSSHKSYAALEPENTDLVEAVRERTDITDLQERTQIAFRFLAELDSNFGEEIDNFPHHLQGSGYNLPRDSHNVTDPNYSERGAPDYPHESLIRIYLYVQHDHALGRLSLLSCLVENSRTGAQIPITTVTEKIAPNDRLTRSAQEAMLLREFFTELGDAISSVAPDISPDGFEPNEGFPHVYIYSQHQRENLINALRRHDGLYGSEAVRTLLGLRPGIDQEMVSIFHQEFRERQAFRFAGLGLVQTVAHYYDSDTGNWFDWVNTRDDGSEIDLTRVFHAGFFDSYVPHGDPEGGIELNFSRERRLEPTGYKYAEYVYPIQNRETDQIPAEYLWAAKGMLSEEDADDSDLIREFIYRGSAHTEEITVEDVEIFAEQICLALRHIDLSTWNKDKFTPKEPLEVDKFSDISFGRRTLAEAAREYQELEFWTDQESKHAYYRRPLIERVASGEALLVKNTHGEIVRPDSPNGYPDAYIEGPLMRDLNQEFDPSIHASVATRPLSRSEGDWCVTVSVEDSAPPEQLHGDSHYPTNIENGSTTIIEDIDAESGWVRVFVMGGWPKGNGVDQRFCVWHYDWTEDNPPDDDKLWIDSNPTPDSEDIYVIDPAVDDITASRATAALEPNRITENVPYTRLNQVFAHPDTS